MGRTTCTEPQCLYSRAIPLLPLCTVRPVQSLSTCTVQLYLYSSYGPYDLYRASVPVQYSYTSTPPTARTACRQPQCLYSTAIPLHPLQLVRPVDHLSACTTVHLTFTFLHVSDCLGQSSGGTTVRIKNWYLLFFLDDCLVVLVGHYRQIKTLQIYPE